jgi:hypothetical protein
MPLAKFADRVRVTYLAGYNHSAGDLRLAPLSIFRKLGLLPQTGPVIPPLILVGSGTSLSVEFPLGIRKNIQKKFGTPFCGDRNRGI